MIRATDLLVSIILVLLLAVPMLCIALLIRIADGGPAIFKQPRVGKGGRTFPIYKFRTMSVAPAGSGSVRTGTNDPRITAIGKKLRPAHLDELPQLLNILRGDMSFVGVRPDTPLQEGDYSPEYWRLRHTARPGLTGPAQIIRGDVTISARNAAEKTWLENPSFANYVTIIFATIGKVISRSSN